MLDDVGKALEYLRLNSDDAGDAAIRCIEGELSRLYQELAIAYTRIAEWAERLDSIEASIVLLVEKYHV